jgi:hypothetical protein
MSDTTATFLAFFLATVLVAGLAAIGIYSGTGGFGSRIEEAKAVLSEYRAAESRLERFLMFLLLLRVLTRMGYWGMTTAVAAAAYAGAAAISGTNLSIIRDMLKDFYDWTSRDR